MLYSNTKPLTPSQIEIENSILSLEEAYARGFKDFMLGQRVPMALTPTLLSDIALRKKLLKRGLTDKAGKLSIRLFMEGVHLVDTFLEGSEVPSFTKAEKAVEASNPYKDGSLLAKEWQRGNNVAYFNNLNRINRKKQWKDKR